MAFAKLLGWMDSRWLHALKPSTLPVRPRHLGMLRQRPARDRAWLPAVPPFTMVALWLDRSERRQELAQLSVEQLNDTGLQPEAVQREASKPFWQP